jgi:hypothetical protein
MVGGIVQRSCDIKRAGMMRRLTLLFWLVGIWSLWSFGKTDQVGSVNWLISDAITLSSRSRL